MTTAQKMKKLLGERAARYEKSTGFLLEIVEVETMTDAWEICCANLYVEKGQLAFETATLKHVFFNKKLAIIAKD